MKSIHSSYIYTHISKLCKAALIDQCEKNNKHNDQYKDKVSKPRKLILEVITHVT